MTTTMLTAAIALIAIVFCISVCRVSRRYWKFTGYSEGYREAYRKYGEHFPAGTFNENQFTHPEWLSRRGHIARSANGVFVDRMLTT